MRFVLPTAAAVLVMSARAAHATEGIDSCADAAERGQILRDQHELLAARSLFVSCAQRECPAVVRASCTEWLTSIDRRIPSIVVSAKAASGRDIAAVRVFVDGRPQPDSITVTAMPLDPGNHVVRCEAEGFVPQEASIVLREGESTRIVDIELAPKDAPRAIRPPERRGTFSPAVYALGGVSVLAFGTFAFFAATGMSDYRRLERDCSPRCGDAELDALRTRFVAADVGLVVGVLALGATATVALLTRARD
jgi:hypothetical protein